MKNLRFLLAILLLLGLNTGVMGNEWADYYFPSTPGSYWIYENQHGETLTRYAIEPEKVDGDLYNAFSYDPALADWTDFEYYVHPYFYQISDDWVAFFIGTEAENAFKAETTKQMESTIAAMRQMMSTQAPPELNITVDLDYDIEVESQDYFYILPTPATFNEEWTAIEASAVLTMTIAVKGLPPELSGGSEAQTVKTHIDVIETGKVTGTETVDTEAGTFEDCLVIEYRTDTITEAVAAMAIPGQDGPVEQEDATVTTLWLAPNVGIVKFDHKHTVPPDMEDIPIEVYIPEDQTLELIQYQIQPANSETNE